MKFKVRKFTFLLAICIVIGSFAACGETGASNIVASETEEKNISALDILCNIWSAAPIEGKLLCYLNETAELEDFAYDFDLDDELVASIEDMAVVRSFEACADMYIIFKSKSPDSLSEALENYREARITDFTGYAPKEEAKLRESKLLTKKGFVVLLVNENYDAIKAAFEETLSSDFSQNEEAKKESMDFIIQAANDTIAHQFYSPEYEDNALEDSKDENSEVVDVQIDDIPLEDFTDGNGKTRLADGTILIEEVDGVIEPYDTSQIVLAYKTGDTSGLSDMDLQVLEKAREIISSEITDGMEMVDKELAIHDYLTQNAAYDENCLVYSKWYTEYADQPYGCLINKQAICLGYTTTFKMFMDMLDIECIIVTGQANSNRGNHAWNMVRMDDDCWYVVDVTWDDPIGGQGLYYNFFNTTDEYLEMTNHFWDKDSYPSAVGGIYSEMYYN